MPSILTDARPLRPLPEKISPALPKRVLYSISARIGGSGLDSDSFETLRGLSEHQILGRAFAYDNRQAELPAPLISSLRWHPVRLLSFVGSKHYYGAKKHYLDWMTARAIRREPFDLFHSWAGDCRRTLRAAKELGIPTILEIPTWHRDKGKIKPRITTKERTAEKSSWKERLLISRQHTLEEYDLADLILVLSEKAKETFLIAGHPESKLFLLPRGTDTERFHPGTPPPIFRAVFAGALIKRKGVHTLLEAWNRLALPQAELVLLGTVHHEIKPYLEKFATPNVRIEGFVKRPEDYFRESTVHIFPSTCEGSAKVTFDAAACGLPQISTRESGDAVVHEETGLIIPCDNVEALCAAILRLHADPALRQRMGVAARQRMLDHFTWDHYRTRLLEAYRLAFASRPTSSPFAPSTPSRPGMCA
ncbi:MAG: glycosyltransferase family 4 protein [Chthoniobacteraceae bacterium]